MKKTIKKLDDNVIKALTQACETFKQWNCGFDWLTHTARYNAFPGSLMITCVFELDAEVAQAEDTDTARKMRQVIQANLLKVGVKVKDIRRHVRLDSEESCLRDDDGNWQQRLSRWQG